ncbi:MAG TPA: HYR domain-containing protein [Blastocatellia bacterium]|nr:HYR domain-containing protein [Blastocatellia bacterium]
MMLAVNPPSGSVFPVGTTTVTAVATDAAGNISTCTFTVTVVDTTPPQIICPPSQTAVTSNPGGTGVMVTYPDPTLVDNCPGTTVMCAPPLGSIFPTGTTTVTCTASDPSGNNISCSFTVTVFDVCLQDETDPSVVILFNSVTGEYRFCCGGTTFIGTGKMARLGDSYVLERGSTDRRVVARLDAALGIGSASLQFPPGTIRCTITDRNTRDNSCQCQ